MQHIQIILNNSNCSVVVPCTTAAGLMLVTPVCNNGEIDNLRLDSKDQISHFVSLKATKVRFHNRMG